MGSVIKQVDVTAGVESVWDAVRDFGALPERVVPGFVIESELEGDDRVITFLTGAIARERLVASDDARRRLVYTVVESPLGFTHHQSSVEVLPAASGSGTRVEWTTDFQPDEVGPIVDAMMTQGIAAMEKTFGTETAPAPSRS